MIDRALRVGGFEVAHQRGEGRLIGLERGGCVGRWRIRGVAVLIDHVEIAAGLELHPFRHVVLAAVLPGAEPEQHQADMMLARLGEQGVDHGVVELALAGFELFPVDRHLDRIGMQVLDGRPDFGQHGGPGAGIIGLRAQHEERGIVDEEGEAPVFLHEARQRRLLHLRVERGGGDEDQQNKDCNRGSSHGYSLSPKSRFSEATLSGWLRFPPGAR